MPPMRQPQKIYIQRYRSKWEKMKEFKDWLKPLPKNVLKAYCSVCNVVIKAHLCDLRKHGRAKKHRNAVKLVRTLESIKGRNSSEFDNDELPAIPEDTNEASEENESEEEVINRWSSSAVSSLLRHLKSYWKDFRDGLRKKKDIWDDISLAMTNEGFSFSSYECGKKFRNIKMRYFNVMEKRVIGEDPNVRIDYFSDLHELLSKEPETLAYLEQKKLNHKPQTVIGDCSDEDSTVIQDEAGYDILKDGDMEWTESATHLLLGFLLEFKDFFLLAENESETNVWLAIADQMQAEGAQVEEVQCKRKWQNLVEQFQHYKSIMEETGRLPLWAYYTKVRHVLNTVEIPTKNLTEKKPMKLLLSKRKTKTRSNSQSDPEPDPDQEPDQSCDSDNCERSDPPLGEDDIRGIRRLGDSAIMWQRLNVVESRLDQLSDQHEVHRNTNTILSQILVELSTLAGNLCPRNVQNDSYGLRDGITLVVPNDDQN